MMLLNAEVLHAREVTECLACVGVRKRSALFSGHAPYKVIAVGGMDGARARQCPIAKRQFVACQYYQPSNRDPLQSQVDLAKYKRVRLERVIARGAHGYLVFVPHDTEEPWYNGTASGLVVFIAGDILYNLIALLRGEEAPRPMALDVLTDVLQKTHGRPGGRFGVLHVAITALQDDTYVARIYYGNLDSGKVLWDADIRPSDATYLAHRSNAPIFVDHSVWSSTHITHAQLLETQAYGADPDVALESSQAGESGTVLEVEPACKDGGGREASLPAGLLASDPELVKMIKRQLQVAINEEDYAKAAQLRDLPIMSTYYEIQQLKENGIEFMH